MYIALSEIELYLNVLIKSLCEPTRRGNLHYLKMLRGLFRPSALLSTNAVNRRAFSSGHVTLENRIYSLRNAIINSNWADGLQSTFNVPHWDNEYAALSYDLNINKTTEKELTAFKELGSLFDLYYQCEDVRDHINQVLEVKSRSGGLAGTGVMASEGVDNLEEHAQAAVAVYEKLLKSYPDYKVKIEEGLGFGLAAFRAKHKFRYNNQYRHHF